MKIAGLTGNIGSGKSTVAKVLVEMGVPVFDADSESKKILEKDPGLHQQLRSVFGDGIFTENKPDRKKIAAVVFNDPEKLGKLNALIHPLVQKRFDDWCKMQNSDLVVKEAAILIESGFNRNTDEIILVTCPEEIRIERVMKRDNVSREAVLARMKNQMNEEEKVKLSGFIIINDGNHLLIPRIIQYLQKQR